MSFKPITDYIMTVPPLSPEIFSQLQEGVEEFKKDYTKNTIYIEGYYDNTNNDPVDSFFYLLGYEKTVETRTINFFGDNFLPSDVIMKVENSSDIPRKLSPPIKYPFKKTIVITFRLVLCYNNILVN